MGVGRIRTIKPEFFTNEELGHLSPFARLMFIGLWCYADRAGRLEDRPSRLQAYLFPYETDLGLSKVCLSDLASTGFIHRYSVGGRDYIQIENFTKHQRCHRREAPSEIPEQNSTCPSKDVPGHNLGSSKDVPGTVQGAQEQ